MSSRLRYTTKIIRVETWPTEREKERFFIVFFSWQTVLRCLGDRFAVSARVGNRRYKFIRPPAVFAFLVANRTVFPGKMIDNFAFQANSWLEFKSEDFYHRSSSIAFQLFLIFSFFFFGIIELFFSRLIFTMEN